MVFRYKILKNVAHFECSAAISVFRSIRKIKVFRTQLDCSIAIELQQELKKLRGLEKAKKGGRVREASGVFVRLKGKSANLFIHKRRKKKKRFMFEFQ